MYQFISNKLRKLRMVKKNVKQIMGKAQQLRSKSATNCSDLQNYLLFQSQQIGGGKLLRGWGCIKSDIRMKKEFKRAFKTLSKVEKAEFYLMNAEIVYKLEKKEINEGKNEIKSGEQVCKIRMEIQDGDIYKKWTQVDIIINKKQKLLQVVNSKEEMNLKQYILRDSKNKKHPAIVLESTDFIGPGQTVRFSCLQSDTENSITLIHQIWKSSQADLIKNMLDNSKMARGTQKNQLKFIRSQSDIQNIHKNSELSEDVHEISEANKKWIKPIHGSNNLALFTQQDNISFSEQLIPQGFLQTLNSQKNFQKIGYGVYYSKKGLKVRKVFQFDEKVSEQLLIAVISQVRHIRRRKQTVLLTKILNNAPVQNTKIVREIHQIDNHKIDIVYLRHIFTRNHMTYLVEKSINIENIGYPQKKEEDIGDMFYCIWRVKKQGKKVQLVVQAEIGYNKKIKNCQQITSQFIGQFKSYIDDLMEGEEIYSFATEDFENDYLSELSEEQDANLQFFTVEGSVGEQFVLDPDDHSCIPISNTLNVSRTKKQLTGYQEEYQVNSFLKSSKMVDTDHDTYSYYRFPNEPYPKASPIYMTSDVGHVLWKDQWKITDKGEFINIDEQKIKIQSSVLKLVVKRMGKNILSGRGIMGMSLPIQIFGTDTNIQRICKGYIYAPLLLEKAASLKDPVSRMKYAVCFGLSFSVAYIEMQKPFNPILGETFQTIIDGCPVYGEQISHHPPITNTFMSGRKYKINGSFEAKVELGLNSASGINQGFNHISYQDGLSDLMFNTPPGQMSGIIYGERKLCLVKKSYYIDNKNRLLCEISWGKKKNGLNHLSKMIDYFEGTIWKISQGVDLKKNYKNIKDSQIEADLGVIYGRFTGKVFCDGQQLFDIQTAKPYKMVDPEKYLASDSRIRRDLVLRSQDNFSQAQQAKQDLEQIQRRDAKLRKGK